MRLFLTKISFLLFEKDHVVCEGGHIMNYNKLTSTFQQSLEHPSWREDIKGLFCSHLSSRIVLWEGLYALSMKNFITSR